MDTLLADACVAVVAGTAFRTQQAFASATKSHPKNAPPGLRLQVDAANIWE